MSERTLKWIINIAGIVCLYAFLAVRILPLFNFVLLEKYIPEYWENTKWGELYYFNHIAHFREKNLPDYKEKYRFTRKHPTLNEAEILCFGDSFFDFSRMTTFPERLGQETGQKVYYARFDRPVEYLMENNFQGGNADYFLYETAERFLHDRFENPQDLDPAPDDRSQLRKSLAELRDFIFLEDSELLYAQLLNRSYLTTHIYSAISTIKFDWFGQISSVTPLYSLDYERPWLFAGTQVGNTPRSFYYDHSDTEIKNYCDNIEALANKLESTYDLKFIFMIIPSKYTIYHGLLNDDEYNNFIPRIERELAKRDIPVVKLYNEFINNKDQDLLYYGTDTHWTEEGLEIALERTLDVINTLQSPLKEKK